jgi:putative transposase
MNISYRLIGDGEPSHLVLMENKEPLCYVMILDSYVLWVNKKYVRVGYLFKDRFKTEPIVGGIIQRV